MRLKLYMLYARLFANASILHSLTMPGIPGIHLEMYFFEVLLRLGLIIPLIIRGSEPSAPAQISLQTCRNEAYAAR